MMPRRPYYAWIVLGVPFLALLAGAGIRATPSVLSCRRKRNSAGLAAVLALQGGRRPARREGGYAAPLPAPAAPMAGRE